MKKNVLMVLFALVIAPLFSHAQGLGSIIGRVTDPAGAAVRLQLRAEYFNVLNHPNFAPESNSSGIINGTDQISALDKLNGNALSALSGLDRVVIRASLNWP